MNKNELLSIPQDVTIAPEKLTELYTNFKEDRQIIEAVGLNPNTHTNILKEIFQSKQGMADAIFHNNPVVSLLALEHPDIIIEWITDNPYSIFVTNNNKSIQLQNIAYNTGSARAISALATSANTCDDIIRKIESRCVNVIEKSFIISTEEKPIIYGISRNEKISAHAAVFMQDNSEIVKATTIVNIYNNIKNNPRLHRDLKKYRKGHPYKLDSKEYSTFREAIPNVETLIQFEEFRNTLQVKHKLCVPDPNRFNIKNITINVNKAIVTVSTVEQETILAYDKEASMLIYAGHLTNCYCKDIAGYTRVANRIKRDYNATITPNTTSKRIDEIYKTYLSLYNYRTKSMGYIEEMRDNIIKHPNTTIHTLNKLYINYSDSEAPLMKCLHNELLT